MPDTTKPKKFRLKRLRGKTIRLKQIGSATGSPRDVRETLKALGLGKLYQFKELANTKEVRDLITKVPHMLSILDGPDILFLLEKSTLGEERIREAVEAVRALRK
jgi:large subunit ribosomal protein L30